MSFGVDVSRHQYHLDWNAIRTDGIGFAYIKATEGNGYVDPRVDEHLTGARTAGLLTGLVHFARPDLNPATTEAAHFAAEVNARHAAGPGNLPPCLDLEELHPTALSGVDLTGWVTDFLAAARRITGRRQYLLFTGARFARDRLGGLTWLDDDCLNRLAHYGRDPGHPGWRDHRTVMHQHTSRGRINGCLTDVALTTCWSDLTTLTAGGAPPTPPVVVPIPGTYRVRPGDTLPGIADRLTYPGGWKTLRDDNRDLLDDTDDLVPGQHLRLPRQDAPAPRLHVVADGENLARIAALYTLPGGWKALWDANRAVVDDPDVVFPGQQLIIP